MSLGKKHEGHGQEPSFLSMPEPNTALHRTAQRSAAPAGGKGRKDCACPGRVGIHVWLGFHQQPRLLVCY